MYINAIKPNTVIPSQEERDELVSLSKKIPFDDRINTEASVDDISPLLVREYLLNVGSELVEQIEEAPIINIYQAMDLVSGLVELL